MNVDVIIIGAGAAGMMCAAGAGQRGRRVLLIDHASKIGERIRISGGGKCNFTNLCLKSENFLSQNPHFVHSALARFTQHDFIRMVECYRISYHEKSLGQLFCDDTAQQIVDMLKAECDVGEVAWDTLCQVRDVQKTAVGFAVTTNHGVFGCRSLVIASGGLSVPQLGATPFGYEVARQFGVAVIAPKPALVPLVLSPETFAPFHELSGQSFVVSSHCVGQPARFRESMLITHRGLSGPSILQISSYWQNQTCPPDKRKPITLNLLPDRDVSGWLDQNRHRNFRLSTLLMEHLPKRFALAWCEHHGWGRPLVEHSNQDLLAMKSALSAWELNPRGTLGYDKSEVTLGGVDTQEISSKTMEAKNVPGLYFIGEVMDVTGWLGGYNFQWAWSSGWVAGQFA